MPKDSVDARLSRKRMDPPASAINACAQKSFINIVSIGWPWPE
jgi:hypothetical protein